jgi:NAD(P)-dependent dehydrogenase (short-subunit alcohol dehydrogenase family)
MGNPLDLTGNTAVVIGEASGIGLALAKRLAQAGGNVVPVGGDALLETVMQVASGEVYTKSELTGAG